jgi:hypothetical protein
MKSKFFFFISILLLVCGLNLNCSNPTKKEPSTEAPKTGEDLEKEKVLMVAEEIAFKEYGNVIKNELPLKAQLVGDSIWIIEGTLVKGADGGTVYIELSKSDYRLLKITHYK